MRHPNNLFRFPFLRSHGSGLHTILIAAIAVPQLAAQEEKVYDLDPMTVTTTQAEEDPFVYPDIETVSLQIATSEITATDILRQNVTTLTQALEHAPGAWTASRGRKIKSFTSFRGQTYPFPDYAIDGMWFREFYELPYFFPASEIDRVEIIRSSAALSKGLSSLSGVINIVPHIPKTRQSQARLEYGSLNHQKLYLSHAEPVQNGMLKISLGHYSFDGEHEMNAAERVTTASARFSWSPDDSLQVDSFLFYLDGARELEKALPPASKGLRSRVEEFDPMQSLLGGVRIRSINELGATQLSLWGSDRKAFYKNMTTGATHDDDDSEHGIQLIQSMQPFPDNVLRVGALYHRWKAPDGKRFYAGRRSDIETYSIVVIDEHAFDQLNIELGYRWSREYLNEFGGYSIEGSSRGFQNVASIVDEWAAPQHRFNLGGKYSMNNETSLYASYSYGQLSSPKGALLEQGGHPDDETRHMLDFGIQFTTDVVGRIKAGLFTVDRRDGIHITSDTYINNIGVEVPYYENRDSRQQGLELEWRSPWYQGWINFFASALVMESDYKAPDASRSTDREIPEQILTAGIYMHWKGIDVSIFGSHVSSYQNDRFSSTGPQPLGDYLDVNLTAGYTFESRTRIFLSMKNLLDDNYSTVVGYYDEGFTITGGLQLTF